jgi:hypothetical protein
MAPRVKEKGNGAPGEIRTPDLTVRSRSLYPTELRAQLRIISLAANQIINEMAGSRRRALRLVEGYFES